MFYSIEDLKQIGANEFRVVPTGKMIQARNGKMKPETRGVNYVCTGIGKLEEDEWCALMEYSIKREGKEDLLWQIENHVRNHCAWLHKEADVHRYAMECLSSGAYEHWPDFRERSLLEGCG